MNKIEDLDLQAGGRNVRDGLVIDNRLFRKLRVRSDRIVPLAFTVPNDIPPRNLNGLFLTWTGEAMAAFFAILKGAQDVDAENVRNFPYASLRGAMEVSLNSAIRIERDVGLSLGILDKFGKTGVPNLQPFAYFDEGTSAEDVIKKIQVLLNIWVVNNLVPQYATPGHVEQRLIDRAIDLAKTGALVNLQSFASRAMPWSWERSTSTTKSPDPLSFQALADLAAKMLAGKELFCGLGPMRRMLSAGGRGRFAELVTSPVTIGEYGRLSLVATLRVETVPGLQQPLLVMDVSKRRWLDTLDDDAFDRSRISGTVFSETHLDRAFSFSVDRQRKSKGSGWVADNAFEAIRRELGLPLKPTDASAILRGEVDTSTAKTLLVFRHGISKNKDSIEAGVPELDKLGAFNAATQILGKIGLLPFEAMTPVKTSHGKAHQQAARMIDAPTMVGAMLEAGNKSPSDGARFTPGYLQNLSEQQIDQVLREEFSIGYADIAGISSLKSSSRQGEGTPAKRMSVLVDLVETNRQALQRMYGDDLPTLVLFHEDRGENEPNLRLLKAAIRLLWRDLPTVSSKLPKGTHGPEASLESKMPNGKRAPAAERSRRRVAAWQGVTEQIRDSGKRHLCLVMADRFYRDPICGNTFRRDDGVNKPSTRRALAGAGCTVQFLLPPGSTKNGMVRIADFLLRLQAAMMDLVSAHWGRIDTLSSAVEACFPDPNTRPREVIGITMVSKQAGRIRNIERSFLPVAIRLDVATGRCTLRCAYESQAGIYSTRPWLHFPDALALIARLSPVTVAKERREQRTRFMRFVEEIIRTSVEEGSQPVILIDSTNAVHLWPWLADVRIDVRQIDIGERQWMQQEWVGARIIRVRQDLTPSIVVDKYIDLVEIPVDDARPGELTPALVTVPVPTNPSGGLYRLSESVDSGCVAYFSVGRKTLHHEKRGVSCYRQTILPEKKVTDKPIQDKPKGAAGGVTQMVVQRAPHVGQWPSPNPVEIVVTLRQEGDNPDDLAKFVDHLRYGFGHYREWTALPAPLFFERVVRDYISHFGIEDADSTEVE